MKAALFITALVALPLAANAQTKPVSAKPAPEATASTASDSDKLKALEA